jgi:hypothetical protein
MLATVAALVTTLLAQQPVDKSTLELYQERFVLRSPSEVTRVPLRQDVDLPPAVMFRRNDSYAVWDERGLTARNGSWLFTSRLNELPTSSRFFRREEILATLEAVKRGTRRLEATAISGAKRLGSQAYFLVRWDDASGKPWQEVLASVDMTVPKPKPVVRGRFDGLSLGRQLIDDRLFLRAEGLEALVQTAQGWGIGRYDPNLESFTFQRLGDVLVSATNLSSETALFVEQTSVGTCIAGQVNFATGDRTILFQGRGTARFLDSLEPRIIIASKSTGRVLVNTSTGAEVEIGPGEVRRAGRAILTWNPPFEPMAASAFDPKRWNVIATWRK